ncbi:MAG: hypothetical protein IH831_10715 [Planctomycetes bacterium]|nr:hypothetical protein [Planctomycetota bacterium]
MSKAANEQINFGCIGVGGKGKTDSEDAGRHGNMVAICNVRRIESLLSIWLAVL